MIKVAVLDNGIDSKALTCHIINKVIQDGNVVEYMDEMSLSICEHGTLCAIIIKENINVGILFGVRILDENGKGFLDNLNPAIDVCIGNSIYLVNLSLGTTHFKDRVKLRKTVNHFANQGIIIITATSNDGYTTYPASFGNVISVATGDGLGIDQNMQLQKGIDFIAPSDHEITTEGAFFRLGRSNSYAAPYVTAMVGKLIEEKGMMTIDEIRKALAPEGYTFIYSPDWLESAWISPKYKKNDAEFYFNKDDRSLPECIDEIDTLVLCDRSEVEKYYDLGKHIVYIGSENLNPLDKTHRFWSSNQRRMQIVSTLDRDGDIDVPIIYCVFDKEEDVICCLSKLKMLFADDGYNAYTGCGYVDSVLYDLEYLPVDEAIRSKLVDFVYWQTYYQQSDLILVGYDENGYETNRLMENSDMTIFFRSSDNGVCVRMSIDGEEKTEELYANLNAESIDKIYLGIIDKFEKEDE